MDDDTDTFMNTSMNESPYFVHEPSSGSNRKNSAKVSHSFHNHASLPRCQCLCCWLLQTMATPLHPTITRLLSRLPHLSTLSCRFVWITAIQFSPCAEDHNSRLQRVLNAATRIVSDTGKFYQLSTYGRRAFSVVAGPTVWISLPEDMWDPECSVDSYRQSLKAFLFSQY